MRMHRCCLLPALALLLVAQAVLARSPAAQGPPAPSAEYVVPGPGPAAGYGPGSLGPGVGPGCADGCNNGCADGCVDGCCQQDCGGGGHSFCVAAGYAFVFLQPHYENDIAFTTTLDDGSFQRISDTSFNNDLKLTPRVWVEICKPNQLGFRVTYWGFDHGSPVRQGEVTNAGTETIAAPVPFSDLAINATQAGDVLRATSGLQMSVIDFEGTKWTDFCSWQFGATAGLRYATIQQAYSALVSDSQGALQNAISTSHRFDGIGPTLSVEARRPMGGLTWFSMARGSLVYGDGKSGYNSFEDITPVAVGRTSVGRFNRNDVLTIAELQLGVEWCKQCCGGQRLFCRTALEGQVWQGAGSPTSESGDLGLFGFHVALGMTL